MHTHAHARTHTRVPGAWQITSFARAWVKWVSEHGGAKALSSSSYLDVAEPFAAAFIEAGGVMDGGLVAKPPGSFQVWVWGGDHHHLGLL